MLDRKATKRIALLVEADVIHHIKATLNEWTLINCILDNRGTVINYTLSVDNGMIDANINGVITGRTF